LAPDTNTLTYLLTYPAEYSIRYSTEYSSSDSPSPTAYGCLSWENVISSLIAVRWCRICISRYRRTNQGDWGLQPPQTRATPLFFTQKLNFSGRSQPTKCLYLLNEKTEFILSSEIKCPKSGIFTNNYWVGWVRRSNFAS